MKKNKFPILFIIVLMAGAALYRYVPELSHKSHSSSIQGAVSSGSNNFHPQGWHVYFSPGGGCTQAVVQEINRASNTILIQAYSFTSRPIAEALVRAHNRGVRVDLIVDKSQLTDKGAKADYLSHSGLKVLVDRDHAIAHNKVIILDNQTVITGSFNFTNAAEKYNAENLLVIHDPDLAGQYSRNWRFHQEHSEQL